MTGIFNTFNALFILILCKMLYAMLVVALLLSVRSLQGRIYNLRFGQSFTYDKRDNKINPKWLLFHSSPRICWC